MQQLIQQLKLKLDQFKQQYQASNPILTQVFDPQLFSENFQPFLFYFNQIEQNWQYLNQLTKQDVQQIQFLTEKILAQYSVLTDALEKNQPSRQHNKIQPKQENKKQQQEQVLKELNQLEPRERLKVYYEYLQQFNKMIQQQQDAVYLASTEQQKQHHQHKLNALEQRRQRCLNAIEVLEEYLAFSQQNAQKDI